MHLAELRGRRVVLLGLGRDMAAALPAIIAAAPSDLSVVDDGPASSASDLRVVDLAAGTADAEVLVRSPGFPRYRPELVDARQRGAAMTTPLDLWWCTHASDRTTAGITGTKGKSTTTSLVAHFAAAAGLRVGMAGNIGIPAFADDWDSTAPQLVIEVSSYQAADLHVVPTIAALTSLAADHVDWHGSVEQYHADKLRLLANESGRAEHVVVSASEPGAIAATRDLAPHLVPTPQGGGDIPEHRLRNAALAATIVTLLGAPRPEEHAVLEAARLSLPGRLDVLGERSGVLWVDDALASNPHACAAGLAWARRLGRPTVVLLGGASRGVDPRPLVAEVAQWAPNTLAAITLPDSGAELAGECGIQVIGTATSVTAAALLASQVVRQGAAVLLCPGAPTPAAVGDWHTRSKELRAVVAGLDG
jgi:UDP-N-acetylmuramoylalanine--D-glutamate ligase